MKLFVILVFAIAMMTPQNSHAQNKTENLASLDIQVQQKRFISELIEHTGSRGTKKQRAKAAEFLVREFPWLCENALGNVSILSDLISDELSR